jgi:nucleotide-binding universal stress UspA family protein
MLKSILIGLDGSEYSSPAVELGIRWAKRFDALLVGLGIIDEPTIRKPEPVPLGASYFKEQRDDALVARARRQIEQFLEEFALRCAEMGVPARVLEDVGLPSEQILLEAQRYDLIVLGQQTFFHFQTQGEPCETLHKVLKNSPRPVVTVPQKLAEGKSVLIAYDGSLQAAHALYALYASGLAEGRPVHVVSVNPDGKQAARLTDRAVEFLRFHDIQAVAHGLASTAKPGEVILEQARHLQADLLVMGAYGQSVLREFFLGSVTRSVLQESTVPLFLYH